MRPRIFLSLLSLLVFAASVGCSRRPPEPPTPPGEGIPIEVARLADVRGGTGVAAPTAGWFQRRMGEELARQGFLPRLLDYGVAPSGRGLSVTGRLYTLPSTVEVDGPPGEVSFSVEIRRDGTPVFRRNYQDRVWVGPPQLYESPLAESALREATDRALRTFARDAREAVGQRPPPTS